MKNKHYFSIAVLLWIAFGVFSCNKEPLQDMVGGESKQPIAALEGSHPDTTASIQFKTFFSSPRGTKDSFDLSLLPFPTFEARANELTNAADYSQLLREFTGLILGQKNGISNFAAYYENGNFIHEVRSYSNPEDVLPLVGPECYYVVELIDTYEDVYQVDNQGNRKYLYSVYLGRTVGEVIEVCTPFGFDGFYIKSLRNPTFLNRTNAIIRLAEKLLLEGITLVDPCNPENNSNPAIIGAVADAANLTFITEQSFWENYELRIEDCMEVELDCGDAADLGECVMEELVSIMPYSCKSFNFEDRGFLRVAKLEGARLEFYNSTTLDVARCRFNIELHAPKYVEISGGLGHGDFPITENVPPGAAQNAAANAINLANIATTAFYGPNHDYHDDYCNTYQETFEQFFNTLFIAKLTEAIVDYHDVEDAAILFDSAPLAQVGYSYAHGGVTPTEKVGDFSLFGLLKDNCLGF